MKHSLIRAFLFSLIVFLALNFLFYIIGYSVEDLLYLPLSRIAEHPTHIIYLITYPVNWFPWELIEDFISASSLGFKIYTLGGFISFLIAALIAGLMGGSIGNAFIGWLITSGCFILLMILMISIDPFNLGFICTMCTLDEGIVSILITGIVNTLIFGALVFVIALIKGRSD
ncbi:MAG: hypothetical protein JSV62_10805 [Promethearchaeota archaeon]|nr:MAG: hypothetical protein JSV62_10805 [Candidatus Lokiarchaeota archaeon]